MIGERATAPISILDALEDEQLFRPHFQPAETWAAWKAFLAALFGLPMSGEQLEVYYRHTGRTRVPSGQFAEAWLVVGRRGGRKPRRWSRGCDCRSSAWPEC